MEKGNKKAQPEAPVVEEPVAKKGKKKKEPKKETLLGRIFTTIILLAIIVVLTAIIFFGAVFVFNIGGKALQADVAGMFVNYPIIGPIMKPIAANMTPAQLAAYEKAQAEKKQTDYVNDLAKREADLVTKANEINQKEQALIQREANLLAAENELKVTKELLNGSMNSFDEQAAYFEKMDATKAMNILMNMDSKETVVKILRSMARNKAIAIIALMDPLQAAQIMQDVAPIPSPTPIVSLTPTPSVTASPTPTP